MKDTAIGNNETAEFSEESGDNVGYGFGVDKKKTKPGNMSHAF